MNRTARSWAVAALAVALCSSSPAQDENEAAEPTAIEQRLAALEAAVATLDTRLALEVTRPRGGDTDIGLEGRVLALERSLDRLTTDVQRVERLADNAARAAGDAQRAAMRAEQAARDAALRSR